MLKQIVRLIPSWALHWSVLIRAHDFSDWLRPGGFHLPTLTTIQDECRSRWAGQPMARRLVLTVLRCATCCIAVLFSRMHGEGFLFFFGRVFCVYLFMHKCIPVRRFVFWHACPWGRDTRRSRCTSGDCSGLKTNHKHRGASSVAMLTTMVQKQSIMQYTAWRFGTCGRYGEPSKGQLNKTQVCLIP